MPSPPARLAEAAGARIRRRSGTDGQQAGMAVSCEAEVAACFALATRIGTAGKATGWQEARARPSQRSVTTQSLPWFLTSAGSFTATKQRLGRKVRSSKVAPSARSLNAFLAKEACDPPAGPPPAGQSGAAQQHSSTAEACLRVQQLRESVREAAKCPRRDDGRAEAKRAGLTRSLDLK
eukprot:3302525-Pleurochrysis_carterae.AAC.2